MAKPGPRRATVAAADYRAVHPPSMMMVCPVIIDAAGEARNTTAPDTSTGWPIRLSAAMRSITSAWNFGSDSAGAVPGVSMKVGATALTLMP